MLGRAARLALRASAARAAPLAAPLSAAAAAAPLSAATADRWAALAVGAGFSAALLCVAAHCDEQTTTPGEPRADLPTFTAADVAAHASPETGIWVTYRWGVYDITDFVRAHPGGAQKIVQAAGGSVEPFWALYAVHNGNAAVYEQLEKLRVGSLDELPAAPAKAADGPYANEPERHPALTVNQAQPFNAEPPLALLAGEYVTPNALHYKRNHFPVPVIDEDAFRLTVEAGAGRAPVQLSLADLKSKFEKRRVLATLQCGGNRRTELAATGRKVKGMGWGGGAISNAEWAGASLKEVLEWAGVAGEPAHVHFDGLDGDGYGASVPGDIAMDPRGDVLLAYEMNGEPLPADHGAPLRVVVPGVVGARSVKWVGRVACSDDESESHWQKRDYKGFPPGVTYDNVDYGAAYAVPIYDTPVTSCICAVAPEDGVVTVQGYAYSGGGRGIVRVDVSVDGGETWTVAELDEDAFAQPRRRAWAWTPFEVTVDVPAGATKLSVVSKAIDSSYNSQPETPGPIWNLRGLLSTAWSRVEVSL